MVHHQSDRWAAPSVNFLFFFRRGRTRMTGGGRGLKTETSTPLPVQSPESQSLLKKRGGKGEHRLFMFVYRLFFVLHGLEKERTRSIVQVE